MLFDLRGRGRRTTIKVIYVTLALLMGGGLVLFGIGGEVSGGLVDAITDGSSANTDDQLEEREEKALAAVRARPNDAAAWAELTRVRTLLASSGDNYERGAGTYTESGLAKLREADAAWKKHQELASERPDDRVAALMVQAYGALDRPEDAVAAQEIITEARPSAGAFSTLAILAYSAGQTRKGDLAAAKAVELTDKDLRTSLKEQLESAKQQAVQQQIQDATGGGATTTPSLPGGSGE